VHERSDVPEPPAMVEDERVQTRFVELVLTVRFTVLAKPLSEAMVIVEFPGMPAPTLSLGGLAAIPKS
jgi:hypothetical protein